jgi:hypothetical protein
VGAAEAAMTLAQASTAATAKSFHPSFQRFAHVFRSSSLAPRKRNHAPLKFIPSQQRDATETKTKGHDYENHHAIYRHTFTR